MLKHVPNMLTALRLAAAPATAGLLVGGHFNAALGIFAFAGFSDAADGFLAKRFGLTTPLGRFLDPAADKALMLAAFVTLSVMGLVPGWLTALTVGRDVLIVAGVLIAMLVQAPLTVRPLLIGKLCTALQVIYIGAHLAALAFMFDIGTYALTGAYVLGAVTILSALAYARVWLAAMYTVPQEDNGRA